MIRALAAAVVASSVVLACSPERREEPPPVPMCEVRFAAPDGFAPLEPFEEPYDDRIGVRLGFRAEDEREFHVFAGIRGELGEGLPEAGTVPLVDGGRASLVGDGRVWMAIWELGDRCDPRAVLGTGFRRAGFLRALVDAGLTPAAGAT